MRDNDSYLDQSNTLFKMISPDKKVQPWTSFWKEKDESNKRFLAAAAVGNISEVRRLLNPLSSVE